MACCEWLPRQFQELASRPHAVKDECLFRNCRHRLPFPHPPSAKTRQGLSRLCVNLEQQLRGARANLYNRLNCDANPWFLLGLQYLGSNPVDSERNPRRLFYVAANWKLMQFIIACCHRKVYLAPTSNKHCLVSRVYCFPISRSQVFAEPCSAGALGPPVKVG